MKTFSPLFLLAALGVLVLSAGNASAAADTSQWKCETCPVEKEGVSGTVDVGVDLVSDKSAKFAEYNRMYRDGAVPVLGVDARWRGQDGLWGTLRGAYDTGTLDAAFGREGLFAVRLGYLDIPHHLADTTRTPFLGLGSGVLTLPSAFQSQGYPNTQSMPLATTLQPVELGTNRQRFDAGASWFAGEYWTHRLSARHEVRDGLQPVAGSFFSTASQLAAPIDQATDVIELSTSYVTKKWQASLAYQISKFQNDQPSLTWSNPFTRVVAGADQGQLAMAPDNEFHQIVASGAYEFSPKIRASADLAIGRLTQNASYVAATLNPFIAAAAQPPVSSLDGSIETFNGSVRVTAAPLDKLRVNASYAHDERENRTQSNVYPAVTTDMFIGQTPRTSIPFGYKQDRVKLNADYRGPATLKASGGFDYDNIHRSYQDVVNTSEATLWGRLSAQAHEKVAVALKLSYADRDNDGYGTATWVAPPQNPLMRKFNLADRKRGLADLRADFAVSETLSFGLRAEYADDSYSNSQIGLTDSSSVGFGGDLSAALTDDTRLNLYAQSDRIKSRQTGSEQYAQPDWTGRVEDKVDMFGFGLKHSAMNGKLELGADYVFSRSRSDTSFETLFPAASLPTNTSELQSLKLTATYQLKDNLWLTGGYWYEQYKQRDWAIDGMSPETVHNLLALGGAAPNYNVNVVRLAARYRF